ncbi:MAG: hypothetical protein GX596_07340 [Propionibacterium sp.]|nr:hypothetical protein [Propionibacterium sp.]
MDQLPDPYQYDPYVGEPTPEPPRKRPVGVIIGLLSGLVVALAGVTVWLLFSGGDGGSSEAAPAPPASPSEQPSADEPEPAESAPPTDMPDESEPPAPVPEPTETTPASSAPSSSPAAPNQPVTATTLSREVALAGLDQYLTAAVADPARGWELLTDARRAKEDYASYIDWWGGLASAQVSDCRYDDGTQLAICDLVTRNSRGVSGLTSGVHFRLVVDDGVVKIDTSTEDAPTSTQGRDALEQLRQEAIWSVSLDERWVAVLSAKRDGIQDPLQVAANGSNTFYYPDIVAMHESLAWRITDAHVFMLHSSDWGKQTGADLWFTVADAGFHSEESVESWCEWSFPELSGESLHNQCLARTLRAPHND